MKSYIILNGFNVVVYGDQWDRSVVKKGIKFQLPKQTNIRGKLNKTLYYCFFFSGKTTSVALVCKELGFDMVEFNASDTRNKTLIKEQIGQLLTTNSLSGFANG